MKLDEEGDVEIVDDDEDDVAGGGWTVMVTVMLVVMVCHDDVAGRLVPGYDHILYVSCNPVALKSNLEVAKSC